MTLPGMSRPVSPVVLALVATLMAGPPALAQSIAQSPAQSQATPPAASDKPTPATPPVATPPVATPPAAATPAPAASTPAAAAPATTAPASTPPATPPAPDASQVNPAPAVPPATPATPSPTPPVTPPAAEAPPGSPSETKTDTKPDTKPAAPFGEDVTLTARKVLAVKGKAVWDTAFETLTDSIKKLQTLLAKQKIDAAGPILIVYTSTDDAGFTFQAEIPINQEPKNLTKDMIITQSPEGKMLKFVHHGSYDNMDNTYEAITNYMDDKKIEAKDMFIEEYETDPLKVEEDKLVINIFVPLK